MRRKSKGGATRKRKNRFQELTAAVWEHSVGRECGESCSPKGLKSKKIGVSTTGRETVRAGSALFDKIGKCGAEEGIGEGEKGRAVEGSAEEEEREMGCSAVDTGGEEEKERQEGREVKEEESRGYYQNTVESGIIDREVRLVQTRENLQEDEENEEEEEKEDEDEEEEEEEDYTDDSFEVSLESSGSRSSILCLKEREVEDMLVLSQSVRAVRYIMAYSLKECCCAALSNTLLYRRRVTVGRSLDAAYLHFSTRLLSFLSYI